MIQNYLIELTVFNVGAVCVPFTALHFNMKSCTNVQNSIRSLLHATLKFT